MMNESSRETRGSSSRPPARAPRRARPRPRSCRLSSSGTTLATRQRFRRTGKTRESERESEDSAIELEREEARLWSLLQIHGVRHYSVLECVVVECCNGDARPAAAIDGSVQTTRRRVGRLQTLTNAKKMTCIIASTRLERSGCGQRTSNGVSHDFACPLARSLHY